jgi:hypothetical protein
VAHAGGDRSGIPSSSPATPPSTAVTHVDPYLQPLQPPAHEDGYIDDDDDKNSIDKPDHIYSEIGDVIGMTIIASHRSPSPPAVVETVDLPPSTHAPPPPSYHANPLPLLTMLPTAQLSQLPAAAVSSSTSPLSPTKSILVDATSPRRPSKGQVRFTAPEDGSIQYPGRGPVVFDDDQTWRNRTLMNSRDRHPNYVDTISRQKRKAAEAARAAALARPSLSAPHVTAVQVTDADAQQNPLYGTAVELFIY